MQQEDPISLRQGHLVARTALVPTSGLQDLVRPGASNTGYIHKRTQGIRLPESPALCVQMLFLSPRDQLLDECL